MAEKITGADLAKQQNELEQKHRSAPDPWSDKSASGSDGQAQDDKNKK